MGSCIHSVAANSDRHEFGRNEDEQGIGLVSVENTQVAQMSGKSEVRSYGIIGKEQIGLTRKDEILY